MNQLAETKKNRFLFLHLLWQITGGNKLVWPNMREIGDKLGLDHQQTDLIVEYLVGEHLIRYAAMGGAIAITHAGVREVEAALTEPEKPTHYFPPVNIIHVQNMVNSQIQQAANGSTQIAHSSDLDLEDLRRFIDAIEAHISKLQLSEDKTKEVNAEIATLRAQANSSRPKRSILAECLRSLRSVLEEAAGGLLAADLLPRMATFLAQLGS